MFNLVSSAKRSAIIFLLLTGTLTTVFAEVNSFELENKLWMVINSVFVSQSEDKDWGENLLNKSLKVDNSVLVEFDASKYSDWDILIKDEYDGELVFQDVEISSATIVSLTMDPATGEAVAIIR